jgi:predicted aminopeptidase
MPSTSRQRGHLHGALGRIVALLTVAAVPALTGCSTAGYLAQAGFGQLDLLEARRDIDDVVQDRRTAPRLKKLLGRVDEIKRFGEKHGLTPTSNYGTYADLGRPVAVWVVTAAEPLRFRNRTWSFPIVGSVPYLGFFDRDDARDLALGLRGAGWDVDLRGASAYSTLGWFADPVLSTMIADGDEALGELADVVLHESFHATLYVKGQSLFDESAADFVGDHLAEA